MDDSGKLQSPERRQFFKAVGKYGFTTAVVASGAGLLFSEKALAQTAKEENELKKAAEHKIVIASGFALGSGDIYPIMQVDYKKNLQYFTNGKIYVNLAPGGQLGAGADLCQKVQQNTVQIADNSLSNYSPFAPSVDIVNIPFWCGQNSNFVSLVTSKAWQEEVETRMAKRGLKAMWYPLIGPRTIALSKRFKKPARTPEEFKGVKFRIPESQLLQQYIKLASANPIPINWGETPSAIKTGVADGLDPAPQGLFAYGFADLLSWVTLVESVPDAHVWGANLEWFNGLPADVKKGVEQANDITFRQNLAKWPSTHAYSMSGLRKAGVQFYKPTEEEKGKWVEAAGPQRKEWDPYKEKLVGSLKTFDKLYEAAKTPPALWVPEVFTI